MEGGDDHTQLSPDDASLVAAVIAGNHQAFATLYDRYCNAAYNHCFRLSGSWSTAEDLTAIVFLECWRRRRDYRLVNGSAAPWLHGIATNVVRNAWRSTRRYRAALDRLAAASVSAPASLDPTPDLIERIAAEQQVRSAIAALRGIPARERRVIELCVAGELSYEEAAAVLGVPVGTVKSRLSRGLARLRAAPEWREAKETGT